MSKKDICMVVSDLTGHGGIETVIKYIGHNPRINSEFNLEMFIVSKIKETSWSSSTGISRIYDTKSSSKIIGLLRLIVFFIGYQGSALIVIGQKPTMVARFIKKFFNKKYKIIFWSHFALREDNDIVTDGFKAVKMADDYLAISTGIKDELLNQGITDNRIKTIYNPISRQNKTILAPQDKTKFIYIARIYLDGQKNFRGILETLKQLQGEWSLDVYGSGPDLEESKKIVATDNNLKNKVNFKGWTKNPWNQINEASALLLNSNFEGLPMVIAESLSYGLPVISSDCPTGPNDLVISGVNGFLYPVGDYEVLLKNLEKMVSNKFNFNRDRIKETDNKLYDEQYDENFINAVKYFINK